MATCSVEGCKRGVVARGQCYRHYMRQYMANYRNGGQEAVQERWRFRRRSERWGMLVLRALRRGIRHAYLNSVPCMMPGCDRRAQARYRCQMHYARWTRAQRRHPHGDVVARYHKGNAPPDDLILALITRPMQTHTILALLEETWGSGTIPRTLNRKLTALVQTGQIERVGTGTLTYYQPVGWRHGAPDDLLGDLT